MSLQLTGSPSLESIVNEMISVFQGEPGDIQRRAAVGQGGAHAQHHRAQREEHHCAGNGAQRRGFRHTLRDATYCGYDTRTV